MFQSPIERVRNGCWNSMSTLIQVLSRPLRVVLAMRLMMLKRSGPYSIKS